MRAVAVAVAAIGLVAGCGGSASPVPSERLSGTSSPTGAASEVASPAGAPSGAATAPAPTAFPPTGVAPVIPAGWVGYDIPHLGLSLAIPADWHPLTTDDKSDASLVHLDLDKRSDIAIALGSPAVSTSILSNYGLLAVSPDRTAFLVLEARPGQMADNERAVEVDSPAGAAKLDETAAADVFGLVRIAPDWSLAVTVRTGAKAPVPAAAIARGVIGSLEAVGPPATTVARIGADPAHPTPDPELTRWLPAAIGNRKLNILPTSGRSLLTIPTFGKKGVLGTGSLFDLCVSMASTVDEIALGIGGLAPAAGQPSAVVLVCRADKATNDGWVAAQAKLIPNGPVRAAADRPTWHATNKQSGRLIGLIAAGHAGIEVISTDAALIDEVLGATPPDL